MPHSTDLGFHRSSSCRHSAGQLIHTFTFLLIEYCMHNARQSHVQCVFLVYFVHIHTKHLITTYQSHMPSRIMSTHAFIVTALTLTWPNTQTKCCKHTDTHCKVIRYSFTDTPCLHHPLYNYLHQAETGHHSAFLFQRQEVGPSLVWSCL